MINLGIIFIVLGFYLFYLARAKKKLKFFYTKNNIFDNIFVTNGFVYNKIINHSYFKSLNNICFSIKLNEFRSNYLHDATKIKYSLFLLIFYKNKIKFNSIKNKKIKILLEYKDKNFEYFFDNEIFLMIKTISDSIRKINYKNIRDINLFPVDEFYFNKKCEKCLCLDCKN